MNAPPSAVEHDQLFDRNGVEIIDEVGCHRLLAQGSVGRLALSVRALPVVLPVNYLLVDEGILIRTGAGTKLDAACDGAVVAFEIDGVDIVSHTGWSVLVQGTARVLRSPVELAEASRAALAPWANPRADRYVVVSLDVLSGRRIRGWYWGGVLPVAPTPAPSRPPTESPSP